MTFNQDQFITNYADDTNILGEGEMIYSSFNECK